ncbi:MAG TPA: NPCBM/NEW2 domain-containing protein, partial [Schlesneria sp.]
GEASEYDHVYWCYPRFHTVSAERVTDKMLDGKPGSLPFTITSDEGGATAPTHNKPVAKSIPVNFRDAVPCHEFLFAHAPSSVKYDVPDGMSRFTAIGWNPLSNSVKYEVRADDKLIYSSPEAGIVSIDIKLPVATKTIELKIDHLGDISMDHSYWCYPRLHRN